MLDGFVLCCSDRLLSLHFGIRAVGAACCHVRFDILLLLLKARATLCILFSAYENLTLLCIVSISSDIYMSVETLITVIFRHM
jgi:hypothetical protein